VVTATFAEKDGKLKNGYAPDIPPGAILRASRCRDSHVGGWNFAVPQAADLRRREQAPSPEPAWDFGAYGITLTTYKWVPGFAGAISDCVLFAVRWGWWEVRLP
jgi:hypothetical protein